MPEDDGITAPLRSWVADNGNGTFSNPLFYDEFSDPDLIRVGDDFYLTGTTMHTFPGLPILHSKDLVNWKHITYACNRLDFGSAYRLEGGQSIYGQGFWAPCLRYHQGTFYLFSSVNGRRRTQLFRATDPAGPWVQTELDCFLHDLSVLFEDDGSIHVVWGYRDLKYARIKPDFSGLIPDSQQTLFDADSAMGEGAHFYKVGGQYFITGAWWNGRMRMPCARADRPDGPYELNPEISADEDFGLLEGHRLIRDKADDFEMLAADPKRVGRMSLHQGGIVDTPTGEWWGFSMMDYNSIGRLTCLSPVTWHDGWPYFGLPGNLKRTPRTWFKPNTAHTVPPSSAYQRSDRFNRPTLGSIWQWNHSPSENDWSLTERPGFLRLHAQHATDFWAARNTLTQRAIGPESTATVTLDAAGLSAGDIAGLGLLNHPYAWIGLRQEDDALKVQQFDQRTQVLVSTPVTSATIRLRVHCDFITEIANFSFSIDAEHFEPLGNAITLIYQGLTFQGVRFALFNYNSTAAMGGHADFSNFTVEEPRPRALTRPIPIGQSIRLCNLADGCVMAVAAGKLISVSANHQESRRFDTHFEVIDRERGCVSFRSPSGMYLTVHSRGPDSRIDLRGPVEDAATQSFLWSEMPCGELALLSLSAHRYLRITANGVFCDAPGVQSDRGNGASLQWVIASE